MTIINKEYLSPMLDEESFWTGFKNPAMLLTSEGIILRCTLSMLELYGLSQTDLTGQDYFEFCKQQQILPVYPSLHDLVTNHADLQQTDSANIKWTSSELKTANRETLFFLAGVDVSTINDGHKEKLLNHSIIDALPNHHIFWKDINSVYLGCNAALAKSLGLKSSAEIIGKTDYDLPTKASESSSYRADDKEVMTSLQPKLNIEELQTMPNGEERVLSTSKVPLLDEQGQAYGVLAIYSDITERKKLEISLENAKKVAEAANHAKTGFIANMSHDIRTPLSGIIGMSQLLEDSVENPEDKQFARWIYESGTQLLGLLNDILDIISTDNINEQDLNEESFDLRACINDIVELQLPSTQLKNIRFQNHIDEEIPQYIVSDRTKLHRILLNLTGNAIKFTPAGTVAITVKLLNRHKDSISLQFMVTDTGIGIPISIQETVFERFFRETPSYKGIYEGHGIGLHIAKSYVELLGGKLQLSSEPGAGSSFYFDLSFKIGKFEEISPLPQANIF